MINKKYIRQYLLLPLLACLMAGAAGCSSDASEGEVQSSPDGNTHITFTTRGIVTENPVENGAITDYDAFDSYIQSLRIIGFCNGEVKYNQLFKATESGDAKAWTLVNDDNEIDITDILSSPVNGVYTFYFIANEEGHTVAGSTDNLADKLMASDLTPSVLDGMGINFTADEITGGTPLIMTQKQSFLIRLGLTNSITNMELVRALAKAQLEIRKEVGNNINYTISAPEIEDVTKIPSCYSLMEESSFSPTASFLGGNNKTFGYKDNYAENETDEETGKAYIRFWNTNPIYIPQLNQPGDDKSVKIKITSTASSINKNYSISVGDKDNSFTIDRNTHYTIIGTVQAPEVSISLDYETEKWSEEEIVVPPFN